MIAPPRLARALLRRLLPDTHRDVILADLDEEFQQHIAPKRSVLGARWWYWRQAVASAPFALRLRKRRGVGGCDRRRFAMLDETLADLRFAVRLHITRPALLVTVTLMLAAGIAVTTAALSLAHAVLLRPLPYAAPDQLVHVGERDLRNAAAAAASAGRNMSWPDFLDLRARQRTFVDLAGYSGGSRTVIGAGPADRLSMAEVTDAFFRLLGVQPQLGRDFRPEDSHASAPAVVMLTDGSWRRRFGADPGVVGRTITLSGETATIVGVLPPGFEFPLRGLAELWLPIRPSQAQVERRYFHWLSVIGRLRPGVSVDQATADLSAIAAGFAAVDPKYHGATAASVQRLDEFIVGDVRQILIVLFGAACLVLLIACTNIAGLLVARAAARAREMDVRGALGATRGRLVRQMLTESVALAAPGALGGLAAGHALLRAFIASIPDAQRASLPHLQDVPLDATVFAWVLAGSLIAALGFGLASAWRLGGAASRSATRGSLGPDRRGARLQSGLVVAQVGLTLVLLTGAGLMARTMYGLLSVWPGFSAEGLLTMRINLAGPRYRTQDAARGFHRDLLTALDALPQVTGVATISQPPLTGLGNSGTFAVEGQPDVDDRSTRIRTVSPNYFEVMGLPVVAGRTFGPADGPGTGPVLVVNETFARELFEGRPTGRRIAFPFFKGRPFWEIIGVVGDEQVAGLDGPMRPVAYFSYLQSPDSEFTLMARTTGETRPVIDATRAILADRDPEQPLFGVRTMPEIIASSDAVFRRRTMLALVGLFASAALGLTVVGLYGIVSQSVAERTREIGVRVTLGARPGQIVAHAMRRGLSPAVVGLLAGSAGSVWLAPSLGSLLFGVEPTDAATFAAVAAILAVVAAVACLIPASRASRIDPVAALRRE